VARQTGFNPTNTNQTNDAMSKLTNKEKFLKLVSPVKSTAVEDAKWRIKNREAIRIQTGITLKRLESEKPYKLVLSRANTIRLLKLRYGHYFNTFGEVK
jgi:hypothetical protein